MSIAAQQSIATVRAPSLDGASNPLVLLARLLAELVELNDEIILSLS